jgi:pilus assembly protein CpaE
MERPIRAVVTVEGLDLYEVQRAMPDDAAFQLVAIAEGIDETLRAIQTHEPDVVIVACPGREDDRTLQIVGNVRHVAPDIPVVVMSSTSPNGFMRRAFDSGASDVVLFPQPKEQLRFAMSKAIARRPRGDAEGGDAHGRLVCVLGPKGGTGKTLTTCNLAVAIAQTGKRVLIVDLDLQFGDVALCMGLPPERTIYDLAVSGGSLDDEKLKAYVVNHPSGADALLAPARPDQASAVTMDLLREVYVIARRHYDYVIADTPPGFTAEVIATIDASTDLIMVGMLDSLSLKNTKLGLETLELMDYDRGRIKLVLNRAHSRVGISQGDVVAVLGRDPDVYISSDREIPRAVNEGIPIILARPQSEPAAAFRELAAAITGQPVVESSATAAESGRSGSLFRLRRK